ncbi:MAG: septal ring lytic transglycosylase RlpA family protein [Acidovorax sp.]|nr:septal ring lytic transglycosylase RlpA family protein [Acidovorax sp.]
MAGCAVPPGERAAEPAPPARTKPVAAPVAKVRPPVPAMGAAAALAGPPPAAEAQAPAEAPGDVSDGGVLIGRGLASWYGPNLHGRRTASGERFDRYEFTAAHRTLPFGARVCVRSALTGKAVVVRINDRGPFGPGRVIDLSQAAAEELGMVGLGIKPVELWHLGPDEDTCPASLQDAEVVAPGVDEAAPSPQRKARAKARPRPKPRRR